MRSHRRLPQSQKTTTLDPDNKLVFERVIRLIFHLCLTTYTTMPKEREGRGYQIPPKPVSPVLFIS